MSVFKTVRKINFRATLALCLLLIIVGCSTNSLVIRYFYSQLDDNLNEKILSFAQFTTPQKEEIRDAVDSFFQWHRRNELPHYAALIGQQNQKLLNGTLTEGDIAATAQKVREFTSYSYEKSPFSLAPDFLKNLTDQQVEQIEQYFIDRDHKAQQQRAERQLDDNGDRRLATIVKNIKRFGVVLSQPQQEIIRASFSEYEKPLIDPILLWGAWEEKFITYLMDRNSEHFEHSISEHIAVYPYLLRNAYPERDQYNQQILVKATWDVLRSFTPAQTQKLIERLDQLQQVLLDISQS